MPLVTNLQPTNIWNAFILSSIATSVIIIVTITLNNYLKKVKFIKNHENKNLDMLGISITLVSGFIISMISYTIMYFIFGYGKNMVQIT